MIRRDIAIINQSSVIDDERGQSLAQAIALQVHNDYAPVWGTYARISYVPLGRKPPLGRWWVCLMDDSDEAGALGYHDLTPEGLPLGKIFARTDARYGLSVGVTLSHEVLEMLGDPYINLTVMVQDKSGQPRIYAFENCDACEADQFAYNCNDEQVSDFVYPRFFDASAPADHSVQLDHGNHITQPFEILQGGYLSRWTPQGGWTQLHGSKPVAGDRPRVGSRRDRRRTPVDQWLLSDPVDWTTGKPLSHVEESWVTVDPGP